MSEGFDPSPRSSKRRKTNSNGAATSTALLQAPSVFQTVSDTFSGLSRRLFETKKPRNSSPIQNDSTYGSKEDSLVEGEDIEDEAGVDPDITSSAQEALENENLQRKHHSASRKGNRTSIAMRTDEKPASGSRSTRSMSSGNATQADGKGKKRRQIESTTSIPTKRGLDPSKRAHLKSQVVVKKNTATTPVVRSRNSRDSHLEGIDAQTSIPETTKVTKRQPVRQAADLGPDEFEVDEETITIQPRSSGRERRPSQKVAATVEKVKKSTADVAKGILTPSRKEKREGPQKSVVFDDRQKEVGDDLGFRDIEHAQQKANDLEGPCPVEEIEENAAVEVEDMERLEQVAAGADTGECFVEDEVLADMALAFELPEEPIYLHSTEDETFEDDYMTTDIKSTVLSRLTSRSSPNPNLVHLQNQFATLHALLTSTIIAGESNSLLLLGSRGSGKSALVNTALSDLMRKHSQDFHIVRLNGFVQTDDKLALREIWRQLGREMNVDEEETNEVSSYAETMASLLGLLAHPEEHLDPNVMQLDENVEARVAKSVVFILDEFDLFTTHPRQTLLYNLFDIAQARKAPIAVIGCGTRMDVVDCLEKRVKSRFSHRWVHVPSAKSISGWEEIVAATLCVGGQEKTATMMLSKRTELTPERVEREAQWDEYIQSSFLSSPAFKTMLKQTYYTTKSLPDLFAALYIPIVNLSLSPSDEASTKAHIFPTIDAARPSSVLALLPSLPVLHLTLLTCVARLESIYSLPVLNFNITYAHYLELCARAKLQQNATGIRVWGREVARGVWEELAAWEVLIPVEGSGGLVAGAKEGGGVGGETRMWRVDVGIEEVGWAVGKKAREANGTGAMSGMADVLAKWCREI